MSKGQALEDEFLRLERFQRVVPCNRPFKTVGNLCCLAEIRHDQSLFDAWERRQNLTQFLATTKLLAVIEITVTGNEHLRLDLTEAINHTLRSEIRRT